MGEMCLFRFYLRDSNLDWNGFRTCLQTDSPPTGRNSILFSYCFQATNCYVWPWFFRCVTHNLRNVWTLTTFITNVAFPLAYFTETLWTYRQHSGRGRDWGWTGGTNRVWMTLSKTCVTQVHSGNIADCTLAVLLTTRSCIGLSGCKVFVVQEGRKLPFSVLWILKYHILIMQLKNKVIKKYTLPLSFSQSKWKK